MDLVENKVLNIIFKVAITLGIAGIILFLLQEIVTSASGTAYTILVLIADIIGIFALISLIVWFYIPKQQALVLNLTYILGAVYVFLFAFAHFFSTMYINNNVAPIGTGNFLDDFIFSGVSFIGLIILVIVTIGVIVIFSLRFTKREEMEVYEKITILFWVILIAIYDFTGFYYVRQNITFDKILTINLGITFLPNILELIIILFAAILIIFNLFTKTDKKILSIFSIALLNIVFFAFAIATVNYVGFDFTNALVIPAIIGNHFIMIGTLAIIICTFFMLLSNFPAKTTTKSKTTK